MTRSDSAGNSISAGDQCVANIGAREQRKRLEVGADALSVAVVLAAILLIAAVPRPWLLVIAFPLWVAGIGIFQYRDKT